MPRVFRACRIILGMRALRAISTLDTSVRERLELSDHLKGSILFTRSLTALNVLICRIDRSFDYKRKLPSALNGRQRSRNVPSLDGGACSHRKLCPIAPTLTPIFTASSGVVHHEELVRDRAALVVYFTIRWSRYPSLRHTKASLHLS